MLVAAATGAVAVDLVAHHGLTTLSGLVATAVAVAALLGPPVRAQGSARVLAALALLPAAGLAWRASAWLTVPNTVAVLTLLVLAAGRARGEPLATPLDLLRRAGRAVAAGMAGPVVVVDAATARLSPHPAIGRTAWSALRALVVAGPVVLVLGALLAAGDAVLASFLDAPVDPSSWSGHLVALVVGAWAVAGLVADALGPAPGPSPPPGHRPLRTVDAAVLLGGCATVFGLFVAAQAAAVAGGEEYVLRTTGLTFAEHARRGFFQLLAAAGLALAVVWVVRSATPPPSGRARRMLGWLGGAVLALTLVTVVVSIRRLALYEDAFGLTMLRLACTSAAVLLGMIVAAVGVDLALDHRPTRRLLPAIGALTLATLVIGTAANPEAIVARRNLARDTVDVRYLATLGSDARPTLAGAGLACGPAPSAPGLFDFNWSRWRASRAECDGPG